MLRKHASFVIAAMLIMLVVGACIVRTTGSRPRRGQPVYVEKHKQHKQPKHKHKHKKHR